MSKRAKLIINKFYHAYGGGRHPALVFKRNEKHKTYLSIKFGTTSNKDMQKIHSIDGKNDSYVHKRPFEGTRKDYGDHELKNLKIDSRDEKVLSEIKRRKSKRSKRAKEKYKKMPSSD